MQMARSVAEAGEDLNRAGTVALSQMRSDERSAQAAALTAIGLMKFTSLRAFKEYSRSRMRKEEPTCRLVGEWLSGSPDLHPMVAKTTRDLRQGADGSIATAAAWQKGVSDKIFFLKLSRATHDERLLALAAQPFLDMDLALSGHGVDIANLSGMVRADVADHTQIRISDVRAFRDIVRRCSDRGDSVTEFGCLVRALVSSPPKTISGRVCVGRGAGSVYGSDQGEGPFDVRNPAYALACRELPPASASRAAWIDWNFNRARAIADQAVRRLGLDPNRPMASGTRSAGSTLDVYSFACAVLDSVRLETIDDPQLAGTDVLLQTLVRQLRSVCINVAGADSLEDLHTATKQHLGTAATRSYGSPLVNRYIDASGSRNWGLASTALLDVLRDPEQRNVLESIFAASQGAVIEASNLPQELRSSATRRYQASRGCAEKLSVLPEVALVSETASPDGSTDLRQSTVKDFLGVVRNALLDTITMCAQAAGESPKAWTERLLALDGPSTDQADIHEFYEYVVSAMQIVDDIHPVRVAVTVLTKRLRGRVATQALDTAYSMVEGLQASSEPATWFGRIQRIAIPKDAHRGLAAPIRAGPFFMVSLNGNGIEAITESNIKTIRDIAASDLHGQANPPHFVYSAYGLSGTGKTYTLVAGPSSVLSCLVNGMRDLVGGRGSRLRAMVAVTDVYGELLDTDGDQSENAQECMFDRAGEPRRARAHTVIYRPANEAGGGSVPTLAEGVNYVKGGAASFEHVESVDDIPDIVARITRAKRDHDFANSGVQGDDSVDNLDDPVLHIRPTPNNIESSRAHTAISIKLVDETDREAARMTLLDMAGAEDVDGIQNAYYRREVVRRWTVRVDPSLLGPSLSGNADGTHPWEVAVGAVRKRISDLLFEPDEGLRQLSKRSSEVHDWQFLTDNTKKATLSYLRDGVAFDLQQTEISTYRPEPWSDLCVNCPRLRSWLDEVFGCAPTAPALAETVASMASILEVQFHLKNFQTELPTSPLMDKIFEKAESGTGEVGKKKLSSQEALKVMVAEMQAVLVQNTDRQAVSNANFAKLPPASKEVTAHLSGFRSWKIGPRMAQAIGDVLDISKEKGSFVVVNGKWVEFTDDWCGRYEGSPSADTTKYQRARHLARRLVEAATVFYATLAVQGLGPSGNQKAPGTQRMGLSPHLEKTLEPRSGRFAKIVEIVNNVRAKPDKELPTKAKVRQVVRELEALPELEMHDIVTKSYEVQRGFERQVDSMLDQLASMATHMQEDMSNLQNRVKAEHRKFPPSLGTKRRTDANSVDWVSFLTNMTSLPLLSQDEYTGIDTFKGPSSAFRTTMKHVSAQSDAYRASRDARNAVHCPLRFQGRFIGQTLAEVQSLARAISGFGSAQPRTGVAPWLQAALDLPPEAKSDTGRTGITKFVQFVGLRSDFALKLTEREDGSRTRSAEDLERMEGVIRSIDFAQGLNPIETRSDSFRSAWKQYEDAKKMKITAP